MMRKFTIPGAVLCALLSATGLSACGDSKVTSYEPGKYSGAPVAAPWDSPQFGGNRAKWEAALQARTQGQNEYSPQPAR